MNKDIEILPCLDFPSCFVKKTSLQRKKNQQEEKLSINSLKEIHWRDLPVSAIYIVHEPQSTERKKEKPYVIKYISMLQKSVLKN